MRLGRWHCALSLLALYAAIAHPAEQLPSPGPDSAAHAVPPFRAVPASGSPFTAAFAQLLHGAAGGDDAAAATLRRHWRTVGYVPTEHAAAFYRWLADAPGFSAAERREAAYRAGVAYHDGRGVSRDLAEALRWWRRAADAGHAEAQYHLGRLYQGALAPEAGETGARHWLARAARQGHAGAQFALGVIYEYGIEGVPADPLAAHRWYSRAADQGHGLAREHGRILEDEFGAAALPEARRPPAARNEPVAGTTP